MHLLKLTATMRASLPLLAAAALVLLASILAPASPALASPMLAGGQSVAGVADQAASSTAQSGPALGQPEPKGIFKRSFAGLGCLGVYDKAKFARLDRVCEECYTLYREPDIHSACR